MTAPYASLRILDFSQGIPGPMATMLLSDFGAEVIKVEPPGGDFAAGEPGYQCWNRNKLRLVLDLASSEGLARARALCQTADVAVFDHHPGELERLGLDHATLAADNPGLLHVWMPPYGTTGDLSALPQDDALLAAITGTAAMQFSYEDRPTWLISPQVLYGQGATGALTIAAGLYERRKSGAGQALTVSGLHGFQAVQSSGAIRANGLVREGRGSRGGAPHYQLYKCADGEWFFLATLSQAFFLRCLEAVDMMELLTMEGVEGEFANLMTPPMREEAIARLDKKFLEKPRDEWLRIFREHDVPSGPVGKRDEWFAGETVASNEMRIELEHPALGTVAIPGVPAKLGATPGSVRGLIRDIRFEDLPPHVPTAAGGLPPAARGPLAGVRVLDLGAVIAGPFGPTMLASLGADVIKVEPPSGDFFRAYGVGFVPYNRGKRSAVLDLRKPGAREAFYDIAKTVDIVIDNYRNGVRDRLGVDYASLRGVNPRIITSSLTGFGTKGLLSKNPGFDPLLQALSGLMDAQGGGDEPVFYHTAVNDNASAMIGAFGALVALYAREDTDEGQEVQSCLANQSVLFQSGEVTTYPGRPPAAVGALDCLGVSAFQRLYQVSDGWVAVSCRTREQRAGLLAALGVAHESNDNAATDGAGARQIAARLAGLTRSAALATLSASGVPAAPANALTEIFEDPFLVANGVFEDYIQPDFGPIRGVRGYAEWSRTPAGFERPAPRLGADTTALLQEAGIPPDRIAALLASGAAQQPA